MRSAEAELFAFPHVKYDDQVDSSTQALAHKGRGYDPGAIANGLSTDRWRALIARLTGHWV